MDKMQLKEKIKVDYRKLENSYFSHWKRIIHSYEGTGEGNRIKMCYVNVATLYKEWTSNRY